MGGCQPASPGRISPDLTRPEGRYAQPAHRDLPLTDTLGPYELISFIGRGGMGEVHLARDTRLNREVALKLLPPDLAEDEERRARFLREARAAAALNHPNVTTIHEVGQADGRDYIAQEYLDGRPLNEIIAERPLPLDELAELAVPLADALEYAHSCGVIHRDLKPANVIVTSRGQAKLLDFGLAKVLQPEEGPGKLEELSTTLTISGAVFGTPSAMSPEQALGKTVDARSDVFSFGALLYEMAAAKPAFLGTTIQETLDKVLHSEPEPLARVRRDLPSDFVAIVEKALRKNPDERYQSMSETVADLRHFKRSTDSGVVPPVAGGVPGSSTTKLRRLALPVALLVIAVLGWRLLTTGGDQGLRLTNPKQLTSAVGMEDAPCWAPEGGLIAYMAAAHGEERDIWLIQEGSGTPVNRTPDLDGDAVFPSISPDGRTIAFWLVDDLDKPGGMIGSRGLYTMPVLGGAARVLVSGAYSYGPLQWSADGTRMAYFHQPPGSAGEPVTVRIASVTGETLRDIPLPEMPTQARADLSWSPDGRFFAFIVTADPHTSDTNRLWVLNESEGSCVPLTEGRSRTRSPRWSADGRSLLYVSNQGGTMDLWRQAIDSDGVPDGDPVVLSAGLGMGRCSLSANGRRLVYSRGGLVSNVWRFPLLTDRPATWADAQQVTYDEANIEYVDLSPDGQWLALSSDRAGNSDLWLTPAEGGAMRQLTSDPTPDWYPRWSPDGQ